MGTFERFVGWRYLFRREKKRLVSVITFISVAGVTVGVAALIIVIAVIEGIDRDIVSKIIEVHPHVKIAGAGQRGLTDPAEALAIVARRSEVELAEPVIHKQVLMEHGAGSTVTVPARLIGVEELGPDNLYTISNQRDGTSIRLGYREVILGRPLAAQLGINVFNLGEEEILVTTPILRRTPEGRRPKMRKLRVIGVFTTGLWDFDQVTGFISAETARETFSLSRSQSSGTQVDYIHVKMKDPFAVRKFKSALMDELGSDYRVTTWEEENGEFFQALKLEKLGLVIILLLVVIVASFNIIGTLILMVIEKTPEIGILKAMGSSESMIRRIFLHSGAIVGILGTLTGLALGLFGCFLVTQIRLPPSLMLFDRMPVVIKPMTVALIMVCSITISLLAALFPAAQAARLDPIEALRRR